MAVYKRVILVGKGIDNPINKDQCNNDCIIIGGKEKGFSLDDLNILKGKIDFTTRIDINAHGNNFLWHHVIKLSESVDLTSNILLRLSSLANSKPLYIHLYSCFAGAANKDVSKLHTGSIFITHGPEDNITSGPLDSFAQLQSFSKDRDSDHFAELAQDILLGSMQGSTININLDDKTQSLDFTHNFSLVNLISIPRKIINSIFNGNTLKFDFAKDFNLAELISNPREIISQKLEAITKHAELSNIKFDFPKFSDEEINNFVKGYVISQSSIGGDEIKAFLNNPGITKEELKLILNETPFEVSALFSAAFSGQKELVKLLVEAGADLNFVISKQMSSLYAASLFDHKEVVEILVKAGADLNLADNDGFTALFVAAQRGHKEIVKLFVEAGADFDLAEKNHGSRPIDIALCTNKDSVAELLFNSHMEKELNTQAFISKTTKNIKKFCPSELQDFEGLVTKYELEHAYTEL